MHPGKVPLTNELHVQVDSEVVGRGKVRRVGAQATAHIQNTPEPIHVVVRGNGNEFHFAMGAIHKLYTGGKRLIASNVITWWPSSECSSGGIILQALSVVGDDLAENFVQADGDFPIRVVGLEFAEIGDVADVVALAIFLAILPIHFFAGHAFEFGNGFEHGDAVFSTAAEVVDLAAVRIRCELLDGSDDIVTMNVVANLLALVAEDRVLATGNGHFHQVGEEAVKLNARV